MASPSSASPTTSNTNLAHYPQILLLAKWLNSRDNA
jgi:hypothetical protein